MLSTIERLYAAATMPTAAAAAVCTIRAAPASDSGRAAAAQQPQMPVQSSGATAAAPRFISVPYELFSSQNFDDDAIISRTCNMTKIMPECAAAWMECSHCNRWVVTPITMEPAHSVRPSDNDLPLLVAWRSAHSKATAHASRKASSSDSDLMVMALPDPLTFRCSYSYCTEGHDTPQFEAYMQEFLTGLSDAAAERKAACFVPLRTSSRICGAVPTNSIDVDPDDSETDSDGAKANRSIAPRRKQTTPMQTGNEVMCCYCHQLRRCSRPFPGCSHWVCELSPFPHRCKSHAHIIAELNADEAAAATASADGCGEVTEKEMRSRMLGVMRKRGIPIDDPRNFYESRVSQLQK